MFRFKTHATQIQATGKVHKAYETVDFRCTIEGRGDTGPEAKEAILQNVDELNAFIKVLENEGIAKSKKSSFSVDLVLNYKDGNYVDEGYKATYSLSFYVTDVSKVTEIQDRLTSIPKVSSKAPLYGFDDVEPYKAEALDLAWEKVRERLKTQCLLIGVDKDDLVLVSWSTSYDDHQANFGKVAATVRDTKGTEITPGMAEVSCSITAIFDWKKSSLKKMMK